MALAVKSVSRVPSTAPEYMHPGAWVVAFYNDENTVTYYCVFDEFGPLEVPTGMDLPYEDIRDAMSRLR